MNTTSNILQHIARLAERDYVTPEDITVALVKYGDEATRLALIEIAGRKLCGLEDSSLCFYVAHKGARDTLDDDARALVQRHDERVADWQRTMNHETLLAQLKSPATIGNLIQEFDLNPTLSPWSDVLVQRLKLANTLEDARARVAEAARWINVFDALPPFRVYVEVQRRGTNGNKQRNIDCVNSPRGGIAGMEAWLHHGIGVIDSWRYFFDPLTGEQFKTQVAR